MAAKPQTTSPKSDTEATSVDSPSFQPQPLVEAELGFVKPEIHPAEAVPKSETETSTAEDPLVDTGAEPAVGELDIDPSEVAKKSDVETTAAAAEDRSVQPEPLTDPKNTGAEPAVEEAQIDPAHVVSATPVAMCKPGDAEVTPLTGSERRRNLEEMSKRPEWLPVDWRMETRKRNSGKTAGAFDRYFFSPTGKKLRSKSEVMRFLRDQKASSAATGSGSREEPPAENPEESGRKKQKV